MNHKQPFEKALEDLIEEISGSLDDVLLESRRTPKKFRAEKLKVKDLTRLRDGSLEDLRLCIKYLLFDLDATRRENVYLKKLFENRDSD